MKREDSPLSADLEVEVFIVTINDVDGWRVGHVSPSRGEVARFVERFNRIPGGTAVAVFHEGRITLRAQSATMVEAEGHAPEATALAPGSLN